MTEPNPGTTAPKSLSRTNDTRFDHVPRQYLNGPIDRVFLDLSHSPYLAYFGPGPRHAVTHPRLFSFSGKKLE
jgi:hypothetical protein